MYSLIFGLFSLAFLLFFGMVHTIKYAKKLKCNVNCKTKYIKYGRMLGVSGSVSLILAILLYYYGIG